MSAEQLIRFFQELLTMVDPDNELSVQSANAILSNLYGLLRSSGKCNTLVLRLMIRFRDNFGFYCRHREEFAGEPGDFERNSAKRDRLRETLYPSC